MLEYIGLNSGLSYTKHEFGLLCSKLDSADLKSDIDVLEKDRYQSRGGYLPMKRVYSPRAESLIQVYRILKAKTSLAPFAWAGNKGTQVSPYFPEHSSYLGS